MRLLISGSPHPDSANSRLLRAFAATDTDNSYQFADYLAHLPVFQPQRDKAPWPETVLRWRSDVAAAESVLITTPAYLHNLPGVLKNALDWLASSGELAEKPTLAMTFTPAPPRGKRTMQSLLWSLEALNASIRVQAELYQQDYHLTDKEARPQDAVREMVEAMLGQL